MGGVISPPQELPLSQLFNIALSSSPSLTERVRSFNAARISKESVNYVNLHTAISDTSYNMVFCVWLFRATGIPEQERTHARTQQREQQPKWLIYANMGLIYL